ncbi:unnamed protein product, partial [Prorocentrum cordatum]
PRGHGGPPSLLGSGRAADAPFGHGPSPDSRPVQSGARGHELPVGRLRHGVGRQAREAGAPGGRGGRRREPEAASQGRLRGDGGGGGREVRRGRLAALRRQVLDPFAGILARGGGGRGGQAPRELRGRRTAAAVARQARGPRARGEPGRVGGPRRLPGGCPASLPPAGAQHPPGRRDPVRRGDVGRRV